MLSESSGLSGGERSNLFDQFSQFPDQSSSLATASDSTVSGVTEGKPQKPSLKRFKGSVVNDVLFRDMFN